MSDVDAAFRDFRPESEFAAIHFALDSLLADGRIDDLRELATRGHQTQGLEGVPGWLIERRDGHDTHEYFNNWPISAEFRAEVNPSEFLLKHPVCFLDRKTFSAIARPVLTAFLDMHPERRKEVDAALRHLD